MSTHKYRMASWWLRQEFLDYPAASIHDEIKRRADAMAAAGCDSAIMFGAHFRWDFLPVFDRLHAYIREVTDALHERNMKFFDHHSSVLVARPDHGPNLWASSFKRNHVYFAEINHDAEKWILNGKPLNSWRMINTHTGEAHFNSGYAAEQFCMNNPDFRVAYPDYVRRLVAESGIDGLMSDDAFFNARFATCACPHCIEKFGRPLPPTTDLNFWGNWRNEDFLDWVALRYRTVAEFNALVRGALPKQFPLMNCCSGSIYSGSNENGLSAEEFLRSGNLLMLEMCGNTPDEDGSYTNSLASQLYHLAVADAHHAPCIGLGYAFYAPTAEFIWAFNKFLGSGTWISTLKHRLGLPEETWRNDLADEPEIIQNAFHFEKEHPEFFDAERKAQYAVYFSRHTRDNYGGNMNDYVWDYIDTVKELFERGCDFDVVTSIPHPSESSVSTLHLPSAACLSDDEIRDLELFLLAGNRIIATGPVGVFDEHARRRKKQWIPEVRLPEIPREPAFPENTYEPLEPARCTNEVRWYEPRPNLRWCPRRVHDGGVFEEAAPPKFAGYFTRFFHGPNGEIIMHNLASHFDVARNEALEAARTGAVRMHNSLITGLKPQNVACAQTLYVGEKTTHAELILPLEGGKIHALEIEKNKVSFNLPENCIYFLLRWR